MVTEQPPTGISEFSRMRIEVGVPDNLAADRVVEAISRAANTGKVGDGKIFIYDLENAVRIRTGESRPRRCERFFQPFRSNPLMMRMI